LNTYAMRVREWYGWHFPEMGKIVTDNVMFAKTVRKMGVRKNAKQTDLSDVLPEEVEELLKEAAEVSMGTEIAEEDIDNIQQLCDQVINIGNYRTSLFEYLKNRMAAIAPNLSVMVGELVGARLIAHAGSLLNLAKHPASTVQILGAEKALFRALKTKHDTPKYGLIYHASLVGQAPPKYKGKVSRVLAAKAALATRMDALGDTEGVTVGLQYREKVERRLQKMEGGQIHQLSGTAKGKAAQEKYSKPASSASYNSNADVALETKEPKKKKKEKKKEPSVKLEEGVESTPTPTASTPEVDGKKSKKRKRNTAATETQAPIDAEPRLPLAGTAEKAKKKKKKQKAEGAAVPTPTPASAPASEETPKKKKKKKSKKEGQ